MDTLRSISNLANLHLHQARYDEAEPLYVEAVDAQRETLGPDHPETLRSIAELSGVRFAGVG